MTPKTIMTIVLGTLSSVSITFVYYTIRTYKNMAILTEKLDRLEKMILKLDDITSRLNDMYTTQKLLEHRVNKLEFNLNELAKKITDRVRGE